MAAYHAAQRARARRGRRGGRRVATQSPGRTAGCPAAAVARGVVHVGVEPPGQVGAQRERRRTGDQQRRPPPPAATAVMTRREVRDAKTRSRGRLQHVPRAPHRVDHRRRGRRRSSCAGRRCRARRRWPGRRSRSSTPGRGSGPCDSTRLGLRIRKRSSSNSVAVSAISSPARRTSWLSSSSSRSPTVSSADDCRSTRTGPAHQAAQPRDQLLEGERLGHVVVAAGGEAGDAVLDGVAGGEEEDRVRRGRRRASGAAPRARRSPAASCRARRRRGRTTSQRRRPWCRCGRR